MKYCDVHFFPKFIISHWNDEKYEIFLIRNKNNISTSSYKELTAVSSMKKNLSMKI